MGYAVILTARAVEKTEELSEKNSHAIQSAHARGSRLIDHWVDFNSKEHYYRELAQRINTNKDFERGVETVQKLELFLCDTNETDLCNFNNAGIPEGVEDDREGNRQTHKDMLFTTVGTEIKKMRKLWEVEKYEQRMSRLFAQKWFLAMVTKLHEYMKRTNNLAPMCCLKITFFFRFIIELDFSITEEIFYEVIELTGENVNRYRISCMYICIYVCTYVCIFVWLL